jgi:hypothetical protein
LMPLQRRMTPARARPDGDQTPTTLLDATTVAA